MNGTQEAPSIYFRSLTRGLLFMDVERRALPLVATPAAMLGYISYYALTQKAYAAAIIMAVVTALVWFGGRALLRGMAKRDPQGFATYLRYSKHAGYAEARRRA